jgi:hypothetical protein
MKSETASLIRVLVLIPFITGCGFPLISPPGSAGLIADSVPSVQGYRLPEEHRVSVVFTTEMEPASVEGALFISSAGGRVRGEWESESKRWSFLPAVPFAPDTDYFLNVRGELLAVSGKKEKADLCIRFTGEEGNGNDGLSPAVIFLPCDGSVIDPEGIIRIGLSEASAETEAERLIRLEPAGELFRCSFGDDKKNVLIAPSPRWSEGVLLRISAALSPGGEEAKAVLHVRRGADEPEAVRAGSCPAGGTGTPELFPWQPGSIVETVRGSSFAVEFDRDPAGNPGPDDISIDPPWRGRWIQKSDRLFLFIPDTPLPVPQLFTVNTGGTGALPDESRLIRFQTEAHHISLLSVSAAGETGFAISPPFPEGAAAFRPDPFDGGVEISLQFSQALEGNRLKGETAERISLTPLFPPDAPYPVLKGVSWYFDRRVMLRFGALFPDPAGRTLLYRLLLRSAAPSEDGDPDIVPDGAEIYLKVLP